MSQVAPPPSSAGTVPQKPQHRPCLPPAPPLVPTTVYNMELSRDGSDENQQRPAVQSLQKQGPQPPSLSFGETQRRAEEWGGFLMKEGKLSRIPYLPRLGTVGAGHLEAG